MYSSIQTRLSIPILIRSSWIELYKLYNDQALFGIKTSILDPNLIRILLRSYFYSYRIRRK